MPDRWPAAMGRKLAAEYLGMKPTTFDKVAGKIASVRLYPRAERRWRRVDLDAFLDEKAHEDQSASA